MSEVELVDWVDLEAYGLRIVIASFENPEGARAVAIRGERSLTAAQEDALKKVGFSPIPGPRTVWARPGGRFYLREIANAFPQYRLRPLPRHETRVRVQGRSPLAQPAETATPTATVNQQDTAPAEARDQAPSPVNPGSFGVSLAAMTQRREEALPAVEDLHDGVYSTEVEMINKFQARYEPMSGVGKPVATVPVHLAAPTRAALERVVAKHGDIDGWVSSELGWSVSEMAGYLSPEQVDAVALGMRAALNRRGFILADQTGLGKGRVLAALLRWAVLKNGSAVFLTEKANLFSDIWRDIMDIGSADIFGSPLILNDGATIIDQENAETLFAAPKKAALTKILKGGTLPAESKLLLATYSQFNRTGTAKAAFLLKAVSDAHFFLDECHNAVGESNTGANIGAAMEAAQAVSFSSATFARNAANMGAYRSVFPSSVSSLDLVEVLRSGGSAMLEALSQSLAEEGLLLRREHDLSNISINISEDHERAGEHREMADRMSPILAALARLAMRVDEVAEERELTKEHPGEKWYAGNFGARLSAIVRQFVTALEVDQCVERCVEALRTGEKPVVVIESTMESLMRELLGEDLPDPDPLAAEEDGGQGPRPPTFKEALAVMLERIMCLSHKAPGEDPERVPVDRPDLLEEAGRIQAMIEEFPDLPLSPIDDVRERVEAAGRLLAERGDIDRAWVMDEISARNLRVVDGAYEPIQARDRNRIIAEFNGGAIDGLVITRAASTGLSLHASERVADQRPRLMIELQIPSNVVERVQFWGRVNRRGQVVEPRFLCLSTVLPFQVRLLANQNAKVAELSANVTANAESALAMDVPDIINPVGNDICRAILEDQPKIARHMGIAMRVDPEQAREELYFANKLLSRLVLLPSEAQERLYGQVLDAYEDAVKEMEARGQSLQKARELDGVWRATARALFDPGIPEDGAVFGRPVYVTTLSRQRLARPLNGEPLRETIAQARARHAERWGGASARALSARHRETLTERRAELLGAALSSQHPNVAAALRDRGDNAVQRVERRLKSMHEALQNLEAGLRLTMTGDEGEAVDAMVVDLSLPELDQAHLPSAYGIRYIIPGDERPREASLAAFLRDEKLMFGKAPGDDLSDLRTKPFDAAPQGEVEEVRKVLDGNFFAAVRASRMAGIGSVVSLTDDHGRRRRGVLIPKNRQDRLSTLPGTTRSPSVAMEILRRGGGPLFTNMEEPGLGMTLSKEGGKVTLIIPGKKRAAKPFETPEVLELTGPFKGDWRGRDASVEPHQLPEVLNRLVALGHSFHYEGKWRLHALQAARAATAQGVAAALTEAETEEASQTPAM